MIYKVGDVVIGKIIKMGAKFITVKSREGYIFIIHKKELTDFNKKSICDMFNLGETINFIALKFDEESKSGLGSFKRNHPNELKENINNKLKETSSGFKNLLKHAMDSFMSDEGKNKGQ
ncbi:RNA-binding protein [Mycoplasmopsis edwardii]|uniref:RNA-binding protein n=1 Tax=Mycoplasmopsis edwardii TaxID=53558 RepID=A0ACD4PII3_9BACT|nr:RNA-binding protein [Mycoplasmopsis edwardii]WBP83798.1 RNA-binding protein [Mycoplasmopsis edwardii]